MKCTPPPAGERVVANSKTSPANAEECLHNLFEEVDTADRTHRSKARDRDADIRSFHLRAVVMDWSGGLSLNLIKPVEEASCDTALMK